jgi:hypothetical protein
LSSTWDPLVGIVKVANTNSLTDDYAVLVDYKASGTYASCSTRGPAGFMFTMVLPRHGHWLRTRLRLDGAVKYVLDYFVS